MRRPVPMHMKMHKILRAIFWKLQVLAEERVIFTLTESVSLSKHRSTWIPILLSLKVVIRRCTQKWNVSSEKAIVLSPDRNKNTPIELNSAHHGNTSTFSFFHFCGEVKYFDASAGINGRNENFRDRSSFWSFLSRIHICLYEQKFVNEFLKYSRLNLWKAKSRYKWVCSQNS